MIAEKSAFKNPQNAGLFRLFPNYAGTARNQFGEYPLSFLELSRPTGKYVSRFLIRELNIITRRHSIVIIGNSCAPGYFFPTLEANRGMEQFKRHVNQPCGIFIANVLSETPTSQHTVEFEAEPFMVLQISPLWKTFEDYLDAMHSKYRVRAKKAMAASSALEMKTYSGENIPQDIFTQCEVLLRNTLKEKTLALNKDLGGIMHRFGEYFGEDMQYNVYSQHGRIMGFITCTIRDGNLIAWHVGYESGEARDLHIYQRMLYDLVEIGITQKCSTINFGRTATEIKSTLGAKPVKNKFVVYVKNKVLKKLIDFYRNRYFRPADYIIRHPFKQ